MTPEARIAAAIEVLDGVIGGMPAERALTGWARGHRFAGARDRAAIRDLVFDTLRRRRSCLARAGGGAETGRALMIGWVAAAGRDPENVFAGTGYAPGALDPAERARLAAFAPEAVDECVALDCPDWIAPMLRRALGAEFAAVLASMRDRAPVFLRVNPGRGAARDAVTSLAAEGIGTRDAEDVSCALEVTENAQKIRQSGAYMDGLVELQDLSPQAAVAALPLHPDTRVLDFCAGGGGKALAVAARGVAEVVAHDADPGRMADLPARAARAGVRIATAAPAALAGRRFDLVLADVPCSGTGTWRRTPDAKWRLTPARLEELRRLQATILDRASAHVAPAGHLAYMTCSLLVEENRDRIDDFLARNPGWRLDGDRLFTPLSGGDGFYSALLTRGSGAA
ncbi:MAG: RsmB/NOP family class I SAM-dependent RNA methyltransferase [Rhodobacteraceae bacterium]|jgi:16S rRNA (cytosine967-C5)-methyltransferase|uniref:RsmB/NOP family class I SAM-dependent RNA methyltransferase n=1 Tax=Albidovulum sp. TaxID=1872424 RepID=UPI002658F43C|nr:RsmB/NOP family class I SAM-dependent RNA methyltransferase [uncultured Defluviimonas sp.]MCC0070537.1 RsmB/NOP family class I SAM-dependent RNA methyltransferase [Paracoccaceae bacterium]